MAKLLLAQAGEEPVESWLFQEVVGWWRSICWRCEGSRASALFIFSSLLSRRHTPSRKTTFTLWLINTSFSFRLSRQHQHQRPDCNLNIEPASKHFQGRKHRWRIGLLLYFRGKKTPKPDTCRQPHNSGDSNFGESAEEQRSDSKRLIVCDSAHCKWDTFPYDLHDPFNWLSLKTL